MTEMLNTQADDAGCCTNPWRGAALTGSLDMVKSWTCPECGCEWVPRMVCEATPGLVMAWRHWEPREVIAIWAAKI